MTPNRFGGPPSDEGQFALPALVHRDEGEGWKLIKELKGEAPVAWMAERQPGPKRPWISVGELEAAANSLQRLRDVEIIVAIEEDDYPRVKCGPFGRRGVEYRYLTLHRHKWTATARVARTKVVIGKKSFLGASPGPCPDSARFTSGEYDKSKVGPPPDKAEIVAWIESLGG